MKRILLISASLMLASAAFAQDANSDNSLYKFDNNPSATTVRKLGTAPEFPFLRNKTTPGQVYAAIRKHEGDKTRAMDKLNDLLMQIGYANGAKDLQAADITEAWVKPGTEGNMGSSGYTYKYYRLEGNPAEFKAWKIAANNDNKMGALYLFAKCGNAFFPKSAATTACINVPVNIAPDMTQISLPESGNTVATTDKVYVYYTRKHHRRHDKPNDIPGIADKYTSRPILLSTTKDADVRPETYTVTLSSSGNPVSACADSTLNLTANINVEKTSSYTGNYPDNNHKEYKKVSKREYKMIARRMRRIQRKEDKIARRTGLPVDVTTAKA